MTGGEVRDSVPGNFLLPSRGIPASVGGDRTPCLLQLVWPPCSSHL